MSLWKTVSSWALFGAVLAHPAAANADTPLGADSVTTPAVPSRTAVQAGIFGQANPPGVLLTAGVYHRRSLSSEATLTDRSPYLQVGGGLELTPAYVAPSAHVELSPTPLLVLRGEYQLLGFMGSTRGIVSLDSADQDFGDSVLDSAPVQSGLAHRVSVSPTLRLPLGPALLQTRIDAAYYRYGGDGRIFYEVQHDTLVAHNDVVLDARTDVAFPVVHFRGGALVSAGPAYSLTRAVSTEVQRQRVGGAVAYTAASAWGAIRQPMVVVDAGANVQDRNRGGEPFLAIGLRGEL